jgi:hypothetical protein
LTTFRGHWSISSPRLPSRLSYLASWLCKVSYQPAAVWWASGQIGLHPDIQDQIRYTQEQDQTVASTEIRKAWRYIFEAWQTKKEDVYRDWFQLQASIKIDGWSNAAIRDLALIHRPYLTAKRPYWGGPRPPDKKNNVSLSDVVSLDVEYPNLGGEKIEIPEEYLAAAVPDLRKNLELAVILENELGGAGLHNFAPIEADPDLEGESSERGFGLSRSLLFYVSVFEKLLNKNPTAAKQEYLSWQKNEATIFARLRIWAAGNKTLLSGRESGQVFCSLDRDVFWDSRHQRDLLLALARRWRDIPKGCRKTLEKRILRGRSRWKHESQVHFSERRAWNSLDRLHWLSAHSCKFSFDVKVESAKLRKLAPKWRRKYAQNAASSMEGRGGWVRTDTAHAALVTEPLGTYKGDTAKRPYL